MRVAMRNVVVMGVFAVGLAGCAGGSPSERACEVFSPAQINLPTTQDNQRIDSQSTGDPTQTTQTTEAQGC